MLQIDIFRKPFEAFGGAYGSLKGLDKINTKAANQLTDLQLGLLYGCLDASASHMTRITEAERYEDLWRCQADMITRWGGLVTENLRKVFEAFTDYRDGLNGWLRDGAIDTLNGVPYSATPRNGATSKKSV